MPVSYETGKVTYKTFGIDPTALLREIIAAVQTFLGYGDPLSTAYTYHDVISFLATLWNVFAFAVILFSAFLFFVFTYASFKLKEKADKATKYLLAEEERWKEKYGGGPQKFDRLSDVKAHIASDNPNDWRIAIVEADIILEDLLTKAGYAGAGIGEMLRGISPSSINTLQDAWEAHKVRNQIAHEGASFSLTKKIANDTILRYERVFAELEAR